MGSVTIIGASGGGENGIDYFDDNHLVSVWPMQDSIGSSTIEDVVASNDLTVVGTPTFEASGGKFGDCIDCGSSDYFHLQSSNLCPTAAQSFSHTVWLSYSTVAQRNLGGVLGSLAFGTPNFFWRTSTADEVSLFYDTTNAIGEYPANSVDPHDGLPHLHTFIREVLDGNEFFWAYIDNVLVAGGPVRVATDYSSGFFVMGRAATGFDGMPRKVSEARLYMGDGAVLTRTAISELVSGGAYAA